MTPKPVLEVQGSVSHRGEVLRLGTWKLGQGETMLLTGGSPDLVARAFLGLEPNAEISVLGARVGSREARSVLGIAFEEFSPMPSLKVLEHLALAVRVGPPRLGKVPPFRAVLGDVDLLSVANEPAGRLDKAGRFRLSLAIMLVRLLPVWVVLAPSTFEPTVGVVERLQQAQMQGVGVVIYSDAEALRALSHQTRRLETKTAQD
ncbi:hypothetical protein [Ferrimicrobium sp.]|uniref:hypothetical protein n=1 Tax=Ferrimicrobium sp. TaxID=2926050 RepID=UPI0026235AFB|nr:hypothetical protein [Ferrimicrobium sp.]